MNPSSFPDHLLLFKMHQQDLCNHQAHGKTSRKGKQLMPNMLPHAGHTHRTHRHPEHVGGVGGAVEQGKASPFPFLGQSIWKGWSCQQKYFRRRNCFCTLNNIRIWFSYRWLGGCFWVCLFFPGSWRADTPLQPAWPEVSLGASRHWFAVLLEWNFNFLIAATSQFP